MGYLREARSRSSRLVNGLLRPLGLQIGSVPEETRPWDDVFAEWIQQGRLTEKDPNDLGDASWQDDPLGEALDEFYLAHVNPDSVVLELGPGTGRLTRHVISRCRKMLLVDYSQAACSWLREYLRGKGEFEVWHVTIPSIPMIADGSVDVAMANGVFEHLDLDDAVCYLEEFWRALRPGGIATFNFDNIMSDEGWAWYRRFRRKPGERHTFHFYHPDVISTLATRMGFQVLRLKTPDSRFAHIELMKAS